jgi:uncharacterized membrane protein required for colicin V production
VESVKRKEEKEVDYFTMIALAWLAIFLLLGLFKGFWKSLAAATSLVLAYMASAYFASNLAEWALARFASVNIGQSVWWGISATVIFILVSFAVRLIVLGIGKSLPITLRLFDRLGGAMISLGYGAVLGAGLLWGLAFLADSWNMRQEQTGGQRNPKFDTTSPAVVWARRMMSHWVNWNIRQSGGSEALAGMSAAIVEQPAQVMAGVRTTIRSPEFKEMVSSEKVQALVAQRRTEELQHSSEFQQLLRQPAVKQLREAIAPEAGGWSDEKIAHEAVDIWQRVEQLKTRPDVAPLLNDPEIQEFFQGGGKITPSLLDKGQKLLGLLGSDEVGDLALPHQWPDPYDLSADETEIPVEKRSAAQPVDF